EPGVDLVVAQRRVRQECMRHGGHALGVNLPQLRHVVEHAVQVALKGGDLLRGEVQVRQDGDIRHVDFHTKTSRKTFSPPSMRFSSRRKSPATLSICMRAWASP